MSHKKQAFSALLFLLRDVLGKDTTAVSPLDALMPE